MSSATPFDLTSAPLFDCLNFGLLVRSPDGEILAANDCACKMYGLPREKVVGARRGASSWQELHMVREDGTPVKVEDNAVRRVFNTGRPVLDLVVGMNPPGREERQWLQVSAYPTGIENGKVTGIIVTMFDITERKHTEEATHASEERFLRVFHASPACQIITAEAGGEIYEVNDAFCEMIGYQREELVGHDSGELQLCSDLETWAAGLAEFRREGASPNWEIQLRTKAGACRDVMGHVDSLDWKGVPSVIAAVLDVTEQKEMESERTMLQQQLFEAQKMEMVGQLAGGIAHDFNNILMVQRGYCELMRLSIKEDDPLTKGLSQIESYIEKASALTNQLLSFSRKQPLRLEAFDFNYLLEDMELTLQRVAGDHVKLTTQFSAHPAIVEADRSHMQQVLMTLAATARQGLPEGGTVGISVAWEDLQSRLEGMDGGVPPGPYVLVCVSDTGAGMGVETARRIFEPFYKGTERRPDSGLGLSAVYGIVRQSGGNIVVQSELGKGTTFRIYLPRVETRVAEQPKLEESSKEGGQLVLVVEDEPTLRDLMVAMIKQLGYETKVASNGVQALALVEREHVFPDLLLTDVVMPEMGGTALVEKLRMQVPDLRVIYMSGYASENSDELGFEDPRTAFLRKPFSLATLDGQIKALMGPISYH